MTARPNDYEISKGTIKTMWGQMMKATDPVEQMDEMFNKIVNAGYEQTVALAFVEIAPIVAERLAIAQYAKKNPQIRAVASRDIELSRSITDSYERPLANETTAKTITQSANESLINERNLNKQKQVNNQNIKVGNLESIKNDLPLNYPNNKMMF